jgi:hypothetical protein
MNYFLFSMNSKITDSRPPGLELLSGDESEYVPDSCRENSDDETGDRWEKRVGESGMFRFIVLFFICWFLFVT